MLQTVVNLALQGARVLPAIEMLRDFSETAEAEARAGAQALMGLGLSLGACAGLGVAAITLGALGHTIALLLFVAAALPCAYAGYRCKLVLDEKLAKLEQLKGAALASRAAKNIASKTMEMGKAAYDSARSGGRAAADAASSAGASAAAMPSAAADALSPIGKAAQTRASAALDLVAAAGSAFSDPATRQAASQLAGEAVHGLARGAGLAAGWIKSLQSSSATPTLTALPGPPAAPAQPTASLQATPARADESIKP